MDYYHHHHLPYPLGLIGCRASGGSLGCCEYDIAVFGKGENRVVQIDDHVIELVHIDSPSRHIVALGAMSIIKDSQSFALASAMQGIADRYKKALAAAGRKSMANSLLCQQKMKDVKQRQTMTTTAAMWLKVAAYHFIQGALALAGTRPMPLHELDQLRQAELAADIADGTQAALGCIGIERATRPAIARSAEAVAELKSQDYDKELVRAKIGHLLEKSMLADCYYYLGRVASESLSAKNSTFYGRYAKLMQISMDLSSDMQQLDKLQKILSVAAKKGLK
jgi:hypothetical protein